MRRSHRLITSIIVVASLPFGPVLPAIALAQPAPGPEQASDPPARVGRLARTVGTVSFHPPGADHWDAAVLNYPVSAGDAFWTEPQSQAVVEVSGTRIVMAPSTEFDVDALDQQTLSATEPQGELCLLVRTLADQETAVIRTPRGVVTIGAPGRYGIVAGDTDHPTTVTVLEGAAAVSGAGADLQVPPNQTGVITGTDSFQAQLAPVQRNAFLAAECEPHPIPPRPSAAAAPAAVAMMAGSEDLAQYGAWQQSPQYGAVWYPQVAAGWVPYRQGHWAYVAPWGWTWIDDAPWGFAPFHYGRWAEIDGRWAWVPAVYAVAAPYPPVYAPALVSFVGVGVGFAAGLAVGGAIGWLPLGPREPYRPWYHASDAYIRNVNIRQVRSVTNINNVTSIRNVTVNNFVNRGAATAVPAAVMTGSRPVAPAARPIPPAALAQARPIVGRMPVAPTSATLGVTRAMATTMRLQAPPVGAVRPAAPGPALAARPGGSAPLALRPPAGRGIAGAPANPPGATPGREGLPPIVAPGARARLPGQGGAPGPAITPRGFGAAPAREAVPGVAPRGPEAPHPVEVPRPPAAVAPEPTRLAPTVAAREAVPPAAHVTPPRPVAPPLERASPPVTRTAPPAFRPPPEIAHVAPPPPVHLAPPPVVRPPPPQPIARAAPTSVMRAPPLAIHPPPRPAPSSRREDRQHP